MVVRLRLQRWGRLHSPFYRVAIADSRRHVTKKVVEYVGTYNPLVDRNGLKQLRLNIPRVKYWLAVGAQPSDPLRRLLASFNLLPLPPHRSTEPAEPALVRALTGKGGAEEQKGKEEGLPHRQMRSEWIYPSSRGVPYGEQRQLGAAADASGEAEESAASKASPRAMKRFPFAIDPTPATQTAWQTARGRYTRGVQAPYVVPHTPMPPPPAPSPPPPPPDLPPPPSPSDTQSEAEAAS